MKKPLSIILTGYGINCDFETEHSFTISGAEVRRLHFNELADNKDILNSAQILVIPGGFSFADDIASGKILANKLKFRLMDAISDFMQKDKLILGICNGFQVLIRLGLLPGLKPLHQQASLCINDSSIFEDRWCYLQTRKDNPCIFLRGIERLFLPVRHMEGKLVIRETSIIDKIRKNNTACLIYTGPKGEIAYYPYNPNGSIDNIAGLCDESGRIFGLMPHPEAYNHSTNNPYFKRPDLIEFPQGIQIMRNAVSYFQ